MFRQAMRFLSLEHFENLKISINMHFSPEISSSLSQKRLGDDKSSA